MTSSQRPTEFWPGPQDPDQADADVGHGFGESTSLEGGHGHLDEKKAPERPAPSHRSPDREPKRRRAAQHDPLFFVAHRQPDGTYSINLTEDGVQTFETALGIARDLGGKTRISPYSTIADIMERTAMRETLSSLLKEDRTDLLHRTRIAASRHTLRGSENPSNMQRTLSRIAKILIVGIIGFWALGQFGIAIRDIEAIPGILANIPSDILNLHPTSAFGEVGNRITDAGQHVLFGVLGVLLTFLLAIVMRPFARIYRKDQLLPGERVTMRLVNGGLQRVETARTVRSRMRR